jgi:hypothetical protein
VISTTMTMTSAIQLRRRLSPIAGASLALISSCLLPAGAKAAGFSGSFDSVNWILTNTNPGQSLNSTQYTCSVVNGVACIENIDSVNGAVDVVGSVFGSSGGGAQNTLRTTTWNLTNGAQSAQLAFGWSFATYASGATNQTASYLVGATEITLTSVDGSSGNLANILLAPGENVGFRVTTYDNVGDYGVLSISNFNATPLSPPATTVPGPLPIAGGATALAFSRRLRIRIRNQRRDSLSEIHPRRTLVAGLIPFYSSEREIVMDVQPIGIT